eukprot:TRINITY_DN417_c1_g1_i2.p1 TRINITY_DN417_c1_g1~~TRINITY_DN417_c1_g1_i2.p1  ORF type:complete len:417 (-),score=44.25 TRINITY_DN417_c1_g1_i2:1251-2501(-)
MSFISLFIVAFLIISCVGAKKSEWKIGRATFYGNEYWLWDIHGGSCGYGYLCPEEGTGWDVAALPDVHPAYAASCGRCYEVRCAPVDFSDNYGENLQRSNVCRDSQASIMVTITDTCPCYYPTNLYSNKRWCCGDMDHFDMSVWAFEKLAEKRWGVIGLNYREVPCDYQPSKVAPEPVNTTECTPVLEGTSCPKNRFPLKQNWELIHMMYKKRFQAAGIMPFQSAGDFEERVFAQLSGSMPENRVVEQQIFEDDFSDGWYTYSNGVYTYEDTTNGLNGSVAICGTWTAKSALYLTTPTGALNGKGALEFWVDTSSSSVPQFDIALGGNDVGTCPSTLRIPDLYPAGEQNGYTKFVVNLNVFGSTEESMEMRLYNSIGSRFYNCGELWAGHMSYIVIQNSMEFEQVVCFDEIKLVAP